MSKIAFLCPYFGKLPAHCQLWLNSCEANPGITWFLFTDDHTEYNYPSNVIVHYTTLLELKKKFQEKMDFPICLDSIKKLGDYKPLFGYMFEELIEGYAAWGHIDVADEIYGNIGHFINDELIQKYDKIMLFGHMTIYKNTYDVNRRFMEKSDATFDYKDIFSTDRFYNFEEIAEGSIASIYKHNGWEIGRLDKDIADLRSVVYPFVYGYWSDDLKKYKAIKHPMIFSYENGSIYSYYLSKGKIQKKEFMYIHFKRRPMNINISQDSRYYLMVPSGFIPMEEVTRKLIKRNSKNKLMYGVSWRRFWNGLKRRLRRKE